MNRKKYLENRTVTIPEPSITLRGIQVKSADAFRAMCKQLEALDETCGIHETRITFKDIFFCPWIDCEDLAHTEMERIVLVAILQMEKELKELQTQNPLQKI